MPSFWKKGSEKPTRHTDPDEAVAKYLEQLHQADVAGASPPASALNGLGDAYLDKGDVVSAVDYYRQAAEVYAREGMHTNAIACLKKVRRHAAEEGDVGLLLGRYYAAKKLVPDALVELETFVERQARTGQKKRAIEAMREVVRLVPDDGGRRERLGDLLRESGQEDAALGAYREALVRFRSDGAQAGAERVAGRIEALGGEVHAPSAATEPSEPEPSEPEPEPAPVDPAELEVARPADAAEPEAPAAEPEPVERAPAEPEPVEPEPAEPEEDALYRPGPLDAPPGPEPDVAGVPPAEVEDEGDETAFSMGLEIERTSYTEDELAAADPEELGIVSDRREDPVVEDEGDEDALTIAQQNTGTAEVEPVEIEGSGFDADGLEPGGAPPPDDVGDEGEDEAEDGEDDVAERRDLPDVPDLAAAAAELERAAAEMDRPAAEAEPDAPEPEASPAPDAEPDRAAAPAAPPADAGAPARPSAADSIVPEPRGNDDMMALAEQHVRTGETDQAGRYLLLAAEGFHEERRWKDAAQAYRRLAEIGAARGEDFEDWVECARQTGRANAVLEALATASRWHLAHGDPAAARRSAEEMFLVDPDSDVAAELLDRIAGPSKG